LPADLGDGKGDRPGDSEEGDEEDEEEEEEYSGEEGESEAGESFMPKLALLLLPLLLSTILSKVTAVEGVIGDLTSSISTKAAEPEMDVEGERESALGLCFGMIMTPYV
jgi:hypothetical protein